MHMNMEVFNFEMVASIRLMKYFRDSCVFVYWLNIINFNNFKKCAFKFHRICSPSGPSLTSLNGF